ncbi:hypothetical protein II906_09205 [bacterium]|nr:hypothetical protein [bacterium]
MGFFKIASNDGDNFKNMKKLSSSVNTEGANKISSTGNTDEINESKNDINKVLKGIFEGLSQIPENEDNLVNELEDIISKLTDVLEATKTAEKDSDDISVSKSDKENNVVNEDNLKDMFGKYYDYLNENEINDICTRYDSIKVGNEILCADANGVVQKVFTLSDLSDKLIVKERKGDSFWSSGGRIEMTNDDTGEIIHPDLASGVNWGKASDLGYDEKFAQNAPESIKNKEVKIEKDEYGNTIVTESNMNKLIPAEILDMLTTEQINSITKDHPQVVMKDNTIVCLDKDGNVDEVFDFNQRDDGSWSFADYVKSWKSNDTGMITKSHGNSEMKGPQGQYVSYGNILGTVAPKDWLNWLHGGTKGNGSVRFY